MNVEGWYKRLQTEIISQIVALDRKCEQFGMSTQDREEKELLDAQLARLLRQEELKWLQRSKEKESKDGDNNTKYYHAKANGRKRKNTIKMLNQEEGVISTT